MLKAVIFDLDGTVLDTLPDLNNCMNAALKEFGCPAISVEQTRSYVGNGGLLFATRALPPEKRTEAEYFYKQVYCPIHVGCKNELTRPLPLEKECLASLKEAGIKFAVVTNKSQAAADVLGATLLKEYGFDMIFGNRPEYGVKPDPASTLYVLKELGIEPQDAVFVGDGETDVQTAKNAGMRSVSVLWGYRTKEQLLAAGAERFAETFAQLKDILFAM